ELLERLGAAQFLPERLDFGIAHPVVHQGGAAAELLHVQQDHRFGRRGGKQPHAGVYASGRTLGGIQRNKDFSHRSAPRSTSPAPRNISSAPRSSLGRSARRRS